MNKLLIAIACLGILFPYQSVANDSAAGITANGIYFKEEKNISIEKEDLFISENKIEVTYIFKNHSNKDITTEIAFPIPDYEYDISGNTFYPMYNDFTVEVNGKRIKHKEESRAFVNNTEYTALLNELSMSIRDFGSIDEYNNYHEAWDSAGVKTQSFFEKLTKDQQQLLIKNQLVILQHGSIVPNWQVSRKYYWKQSFPANSTTKIKHSYSPYVSFAYFASKQEANNLLCIDRETEKWLEKRSYEQNYRFVDYIVTTANNWQRPIRSFHLTVEGAGDEDNIHVLACFPKKLIKTSASKYESTLSDFVPKQNIRVYFIGH